MGEEIEKIQKSPIFELRNSSNNTAGRSEQFDLQLNMAGSNPGLFQKVESFRLDTAKNAIFCRSCGEGTGKHSAWVPLLDFTGGQASIWRRHYLQFAPKTLNKPYQMLLHNDEQLFALSHEPFPSQESIFFDSFNTPISGFLPQIFPIPITLAPRVIPSHSTSVIGFPAARTNYQFENQNQTVWGQVASSNLLFTYHSLAYVGDAGISNTNTQVLTDIENYLQDYSQVEPMYSLLDQLDATSNNGLTPLDENPNNQLMQNGTESPISDGFLPQRMNWIARDSNENLVVQPEVNANDQSMQNGTESSISSDGFFPQRINWIARDSTENPVVQLEVYIRWNPFELAGSMICSTWNSNPFI